jgi:hypothetical protein
LLQTSAEVNGDKKALEALWSTIKPSSLLFLLIALFASFVGA